MKNTQQKKQIFGLRSDFFSGACPAPVFWTSANAKKSFADYAIPKSIPTFEANLHPLQLKHAFIDAQPRLGAAHGIRTIRRVENSNRIFFAEDTRAFTGTVFYCNAAPEAGRDFKICLKNRATLQILEKKAMKRVKNTQKHASGNINLPDMPTYFKICNRTALKNP